MILNLEQVKKHYTEMDDSELERIAEFEVAFLPLEIQPIVIAEIKKRGLDEYLVIEGTKSFNFSEIIRSIPSKTLKYLKKYWFAPIILGILILNLCYDDSFDLARRGYFNSDIQSLIRQVYWGACVVAVVLTLLFNLIQRDTLNHIKSAKWNLKFLGSVIGFLFLWSVFYVFILWFFIISGCDGIISHDIIYTNELHVKDTTEEVLRVSHYSATSGFTGVNNTKDEVIYFNYDNKQNQDITTLDNAKVEFDVGLLNIPFNPRVKEIIPYQPPESNQK